MSSLPQARVLDTAAATLCRCACYRVDPAGARVLRARVNDPALAAAAGADARSQVWFEDLQVESRSAAAVRLRAAEMRREISPGGRWRAVVLTYLDGVAELIIVASRRHYQLRDLDGLYDLLTSDGLRSPHTHQANGDPPPPPDAATLERLLAADTRLDGMSLQPRGQRREGRVESEAFPETPGAAMGWRRELESLDRMAVALTAAVGMTLARFCDCEVPLLAVFTDTAWRAALIPVSTHLQTTDELLDSVAESLRNPVHDSPELRARLKAGGRELHTYVAVVCESQVPGEGGARMDALTFVQCPCALTCELVATGRGLYRLVCRFEASELVAEVLQHFVDAAAGAYRQLATGRPLHELELASPVLLPPTGTASAHGGMSRIEELVSRAARSNPDADALACCGRRISYEQLSERSSRLARCMESLGVQPGDRVGIFMERSAELVLVMLAVWKAGASYVPIDARCPAERARFICTDAGVRLLIRDAPDAESSDYRTLAASELFDRAQSLQRVAEAAVRGGSPADEAYVIYTSGSSGRPKGVSVSHGNVVSLLEATHSELNLSPRDVWTLFHSPAFDFSVWEIWICLLTGGKLIIVSYATSRDPAAFQQLLEEEHVTVLSQTPSAFAVLIEQYRRRRSRNVLRLVVLGGESLDAQILVSWFDRFPESVCRVVNMYGITETTVHVTLETLTRWHALSRSRCVGRPLAGWQVYVADEHGRRLPPGAVGEIWVGGAGVANGYVNQPALTNSRFVTLSGAGGRVYRSGDKGRLHQDGRLEHLGRLDDQVKLRGFRIELEEIRTALLDTPGVTSAAILLRRRNDADPSTAYLAAFIVSSGSNAISATRQRLRRILPDYMVPDALIEVPSLPLTANGKLDLRQLAQLEVAQRPAGELSVAATSDPVAVVRNALMSVLGVPVAEHDNFFDVGGNSMAAIRVVEHLQAIGIQSICARDLYDHQTSAELAQLLRPP